MKIIVGLLLILAGCLKSLGLFNDPIVLQQPDWTRSILPFEIAAEFGIGILALCGICWRQMRWVAIALFTGFASYSFWLAFQGAASCGCFRTIQVNPWWTFGLDVVVVGGLIGEWWWERRVENGLSPNLSPGYGGEGQLVDPSPNLSPVPARREGEGLLKVAGIGGVSLALLLVLVWQTRPIVHADGLLQTASGLTILEPTEWNGQPFPLKESIDIDLSQDEWLVVLHRHDCHDCQEAVPLYEELAARDAGKRVALVEVPPYAEEDPSPSLSPEYRGEGHVVGYRGEGHKCVVGRLTAEREWFVQTPVEIRIRDGVVVAASTELPGIRGTRTVAKLATVGH